MIYEEDIFAESLKKVDEFNKYESEYGIAEDTKGSGKQIALTQQPYITDGEGDAPVFKATGIDISGTEWMLTWYVVDNWQEVAELGDDQELVKEWEYYDEAEEI